jgi:spermidine synthase
VVRRREVAPFFAFFLLSGFCSLVDQVVWLRLAMAQFGVTTPMVSLVLSLFMGGLALGSMVAARIGRRLGGTAPVLLRLYAAAELLIGLSAVVVPAGLAFGRRAIAALGAEADWGSLAHYALAGAWVGILILPFCTAMGATVPLAMEAIRGMAPREAPWSFSYLYLANVLGAGLGTLVSAFVLIERLGFQGTLRLAALLNLLIAAAAGWLSRRVSDVAGGPEAGPRPASSAAPLALPLLFATGLASMGMEVVWVRQFTPYLGTVVYAFALVLGAYLAATFVGSFLYRRLARAAAPGAAASLAAFSALAAHLPALAADPRLGGDGLALGALRVGLGIGPFCVALGALTPMLVDGYSGGDGARAGRAYAVNVAGCILGPLAAAFGLLPALAERWALLVLSAPVAALAVAAAAGPAARGWGGVAAAAAIALAALTRGHETLFTPREVRRDYTATVVAAGAGPGKHLLVNGVGMTELSPATKMMAHLPLALLGRPPRSVLVICFGMGTSFRSAMSWGASVTAVELVPSVPALFGFYHADGPALLRRPNARVVVDDGRRFLERTRERFDLVLVDPPPPPEAAGSSLLYSREFYALVRQRLAAGGLLQQWVPGGDRETVAAFTRALAESFPHARAYPSVLQSGVHYVAGESPWAVPAPEELAARLPAAALDDLLEWGPHRDAASQFRAVVGREIPLARLAGLARVGALTDDRPVNEYYFLRRLARPGPRRGDPWRFKEP